VPPLIPPTPPIRRLSPAPTRSTFLFGPRGTGKSTYALQCFPDALFLDLRSGPVARMLAAEPERLHETLDSAAVGRWGVIDEVQRVPAILDAVHQRMDREAGCRFLLTGSSARVAPDAIGAAREGLVYQHLAAWCEADRSARLSTWRTTGGVEVDFVVETAAGLVAVEVKSGHTLRPADRRGLLAFHDEFPDARLVALADVPVRQQQGPITIFPLAEFLLGIVPGATLAA
jgi:predicted AAA+ superfamily ATPase